MGFFSKKIGPVFLKETSDASEFIDKMQELQKKATSDVVKEIEKQIKLAQYGIMGENNVAFELRNSGMDMYILHDIYLEINGLSAQIDYIVITRRHIHIIECKNLIGNIEIDNAGNFIRTYEMMGKKVKEGVYSPITQNERHMQVLKEIRKESKNNFLSKMLFEKYFDSEYRSVIVLANPKTFLNAKFAKKEVKDKVIRADQLITYIKRVDEAAKEDSISLDNMHELAMFYLSKNQPARSDYAKKYEELVERVCETNVMQEALPNPTVEVQEEKRATTAAVQKNEPVQSVVTADATKRDEIVKKLKAYRLEQSRKENIKPYYIFNDTQMNDLIDKNPKTKDELLKVSGFGPAKTQKYGNDILKCLER